MAQPMPLPLTVSCFSKIQIGFTFLVRAHPGSPGQWAVKRVCVCLCNGTVSVRLSVPSIKKGTFAAVGPTGKIYRLITAAARQARHSGTAFSSKGEQCHVVS